jgi:hypothetical protein
MESCGLYLCPLPFIVGFKTNHRDRSQGEVNLTLFVPKLGKGRAQGEKGSLSVTPSLRADVHALNVNTPTGAQNALDTGPMPECIKAKK